MSPAAEEGVSSLLVRQGSGGLRFRVEGSGLRFRAVVRGAPAVSSGWLRSEVHVRDRVCVREILRGGVHRKAHIRLDHTPPGLQVIKHQRRFTEGGS